MPRQRVISPLMGLLSRLRYWRCPGCKRREASSAAGDKQYRIGTLYDEPWAPMPPRHEP